MTTPAPAPVVVGQDIPPFTDAQARALGQCRFVSTNLARTWLLALTRDEALVKAIGLGGFPVCRQQWSDPTDLEWEIKSSHPEAVAAAVKLMEQRAA